MQLAKEKMKDMASKAKEKKEVQNAKREEKAERRVANSREEKDIAHELSKARQAEAKMEYHLERAEHRAETLAHRAAGTNHPATSHSALAGGGGGGGGTFYNAQGQAIGGMPGGGAVGAGRPPGVVDTALMHGGMPARPGVGNAAPVSGGMTMTPPVGAVYPPGVGGGASSTDGAGVGKNNYV